MRIKLLAAFCVSGLLALSILFFPAAGNAGVNVNINIPLPGLIIAGPPVMAVIPGTYAYVASNVEADLFFYHGYWYRPYGGQWYISLDYNGPWGYIAIERVPPIFISLPPHYRHAFPGYERIPYHIVKRNWWAWENERYWDNYKRRRGHDDYKGGYARHRGHGTGMGHRGRH